MLKTLLLPWVLVLLRVQSYKNIANLKKYSYLCSPESVSQRSRRDIMLLTLGKIRNLPLLAVLTFAVVAPRVVWAQFVVDTSEISIAKGSLLISEILFNPEGDGADYVELYNATSDSISLQGVNLVRWTDGALHRFHALPAHSVPPYDYVCLTTDAADVRAHFTVRHPDKLVELPSMPPYYNTSGTVIVALDDSTIIDRFDYTETMHSPMLRSVEGVSLERRSFFIETQQLSNWSSAASTAGYGTPTARNSQSAEFLYVTDDFTLNTDLISPDNDGYNDWLDITYRLSDSHLHASIIIYDITGHAVRHLMRNALLGTEGTVSWDGLDDRGHRCPHGSYVVLIDVCDANGRCQRSKRSVNVY
jgi:hypothetical protein